MNASNEEAANINLTDTWMLRGLTFPNNQAVVLDPKRGYFKGQAYRLKFELTGYQPAEVVVRPALSGWYFGNIVFGGLIGMLVVDPITGSMWNLTPDKIEQSLTPAQASLLRQGHGFMVVLVAEATPAERASMVRVN